MGLGHKGKREPGNCKSRQISGGFLPKGNKNQMEAD